MGTGGAGLTRGLRADRPGLLGRLGLNGFGLFGLGLRGLGLFGLGLSGLGLRGLGLFSLGLSGLGLRGLGLFSLGLSGFGLNGLGLSRLGLFGLGLNGLGLGGFGLFGPGLRGPGSGCAGLVRDGGNARRSARAQYLIHVYFGLLIALGDAYLGGLGTEQAEEALAALVDHLKRHVRKLQIQSGKPGLNGFLDCFAGTLYRSHQIFS